MNNAFFVDTHCHLNTLEEMTGESFSSLLERMETLPEAFIHVACSAEDFEDARMRSEEYGNIYATYGIHPEHAKTYETEKYFLDDYLSHPRCVGCGEFGLDYHYENYDRNLQIRVFEDQLSLALGTDKPLVLHLRDAEDDSIAILKNANIKDRKIHVHCFTGSLSFAENLLALSDNIYIGFTGIITFKNAENVRAAANSIPLDKMLLETDAPYLAPVPFRGMPANSSMIPCIAEKLASIKNVSLDTLYETIRENTKIVYGI